MRFSTVAGERGAADAVRDVRGFAVKFYADAGNWELVGNNTPVFFVRDPYKFPEFIHTQKRDHPLAFNASIAFEQSYGGIDGDSDSGAEICCLLSALTDVPLRQDPAMTGAIDQVGHILPIGGVNEKIEGFYDACRDIGLTGTQGVIIPRANAGDLVLREDVVESCSAGQFSVYAIDTVQEAVELFTEMPVGERDGDGTYPQSTLLGLAVRRGWEYWKKAAPHVFDPSKHEQQDEQP